jgi:glyoxylase-like metal-dependent hydrolase (beta-lactamase superfamily II)
LAEECGKTLAHRMGLGISDSRCLKKEQPMQRITPNVYIATGTIGCNTGIVVTSEGVVMVDTPYVPAQAKHWRDEIARFGPLRYVIDGEPHPDHISGNCWFGGVLIAHEGTRQAILTASREELEGMLREKAPDQLPLNPAFKYRLPDVTFTQRMTLHLGSHTFELINLPGHTPYQIAVYVPEERVVFTSDNVVNLASGLPMLHDAVPYAWLDSLKQLQQLEIDTIIPGHGPVCGKSYLDEMSEFIQYWISYIEAAIANSWSLEATLEKLTLEGKYPLVSSNPRVDKMRRLGIQHLYQEIKNQAGSGKHSCSGNRDETTGKPQSLP